MRKNTRTISQSSLSLGLAILLAAVLAAPAFAQQAAAPAAAPSLDSVLKDLAAYDSGITSDAFWKMRAIVLAAKDDPAARKAVEAKLLMFLDTEATDVAKDSVCRMLRIIGGDASVPILRKMLRAQDTTDRARYALEKIPGAAADAALIDTLSATSGPVRLGIISSLADRKTTAAIAALERLLLGSDPQSTVAAAYALGRIGGKDAAKALGTLLGLASPAPLKSATASALIVCADGFLAAKDVPAAAAIYDRILSEKLPVPIKKAAMRGKIMAAGAKARDLILAMLAAPDPEMQLPAIEQVAAFFNDDNIGSVCAALPKIPAANQVALIAVLAGYRASAVTEALTAAVKSDRKDVRLAALKAFEKAGDATSVGLLAGLAAAAPTDEQAAARAALWGMKGKPVDEGILVLLGGAPAEPIQVELAQAIGERRIFSGKNAAMKLVDAPSARVRREAVKAVRTIGTPSDIPGLLNALVKASEESERIGIEMAITGLAQKISLPDGRANAVKARLLAEKDPATRAILCRLLGRIGDDSALPLLRRALGGADAPVADAAARALAEWPTAAAKEDILELARASKGGTIQVLALRGYVRLTAAEKYRRREEAVKDFKQALDLAARPEERKLVLGALPDFACAEALKLAESQLAVAGVQEEAKAAVKKIQGKIAAGS